MADLVITPANVLKAANPVTRPSLIAFEAIEAGEVLMKRSADNKVALADANVDSLDEIFGVALNDAAVSQPVEVQIGGVITLGVGAQGVPYFLSNTPGKIAPIADVTGSGTRVAGLGIGNGTGINLQLQNSGIDIP